MQLVIFYLYLIFYVCVLRFDVIGNFEKFVDFEVKRPESFVSVLCRTCPISMRKSKPSWCASSVMGVNVIDGSGNRYRFECTRS